MGLRDIPKFVSQEKKTGIFENKQTNWGMHDRETHQKWKIFFFINFEKYKLVKSSGLP